VSAPRVRGPISALGDDPVAEPSPDESGAEGERTLDL